MVWLLIIWIDLVQTKATPLHPLPSPPHNDPHHHRLLGTFRDTCVSMSTYSQLCWKKWMMPWKQPMMIHSYRCRYCVGWCFAGQNEKPGVAGDILSITFCNKCESTFCHVTPVWHWFNCTIHAVQQHERRRLKPTNQRLSHETPRSWWLS